MFHFRIIDRSFLASISLSKNRKFILVRFLYWYQDNLKYDSILSPKIGNYLKFYCNFVYNINELKVICRVLIINKMMISLLEK